ncbi:MAG TPA: hypothetical protein VHA52_05390 [Candidatus Babeliaceae bacterium]|nr:hypothetical protein [Candidatus Babeliaceae bacterium]
MKKYAIALISLACSFFANGIEPESRVVKQRPKKSYPLPPIFAYAQLYVYSSEFMSPLLAKIKSGQAHN